MEPLSGMSIAGEFNSKFDADLAVAMLTDAGFEAMVMADPAHSVAPHLVTEHGFKVIVRQEVVKDARVLLEQTNNAEVEALDTAFFHRRLIDRPSLGAMVCVVDFLGRARRVCDHWIADCSILLSKPFSLNRTKTNPDLCHSLAT